MKKKDKRVSAKKILLILLIVLLSVVLLTLIAAVAYVEGKLNLMNRNPDDSTISPSEYQEYLNSQTDPDFTGETIDPGDVDWGSNNEPVINEKHIINIMLIGQDRRPGEGRQRSDVMILCTLNTDTKELTMTSFMRDMYVQIPGYDDNRMNACYAFAGMKLLNKCMETNFGIHVDGNLEVDFNGFTDVINAIGGVDINLSNSEANHLITHGFSASAGMNHLSGEAALMYARNRSVGNGDFTRTQRQRKLVSAVVEKCRGMSVAQLNSLLETVLPMITTDMTNQQIWNYMAAILPILKDLKLNTQQIPADGTFKYASIRGMSVLLPDLEANRKILKSIMEAKQ